MNYPNYSFFSNQNSNEFFFESIGSKGLIMKVIAFQETDIENIYNLALADVNPETGEIDDKIVSDNGDMMKILATIFHIIKHFIDYHPNYQIYFTSDSLTRNRLYRMAINNAYSELNADFELFGFLNNQPEPFISNKPYHAFLLKKR